MSGGHGKLTDVYEAGEKALPHSFSQRVYSVQYIPT